LPADSSSSSTRADAKGAKPRPAARPRERVTRFGLDGELLAWSARGDGRHLVLKVELGGRPAVVKLYGRKRDWLRDWLRDVGQRLLVGKSGMTPAARCRTERETLALWRAHGFDVPAALDLPLPPEVPPLRLVSEWIEGRLLQVPIRDPDVPLAEKQRLVARLAAEWGRRHELALRLREPRLLQTHAMLGHVLWVAAGATAAGSAERLVTFDFEVTWARRAASPRRVAQELMQLLESIAAFAPLQEIGPLIAAFAAAYPEPGWLPRCNAFARACLWLRERGPRRKQAVVRHLDEVRARSEAQREERR
jgi:hypothetical protein